MDTQKVTWDGFTFPVVVHSAISDDVEVFVAPGELVAYCLRYANKSVTAVAAMRLPNQWEGLLKVSPKIGPDFYYAAGEFDHEPDREEIFNAAIGDFTWLGSRTNFSLCPSDFLRIDDLSSIRDVLTRVPMVVPEVEVRFTRLLKLLKKS